MIKHLTHTSKYYILIYAKLKTATKNNHHRQIEYAQVTQSFWKTHSQAEENCEMKTTTFQPNQNHLHFAGKWQKIISCLSSMNID